MCQNMSGLSTAEVEFRKKAGLSNESVDSSTKTVAQIIRSNVVTYYNLIFLIITILLIVVGSFRDLTFLPIIIANMLIGIIQELRSKKILDDLTILNTPKITVRRNGSNQEVLADELVQDDVITLSAGGQIPADALVLSGNITVNEALITGEADEIVKKDGDSLFSGSFVISGECMAKLEKVGKDSYISGLMLQATQAKEGEQSEISGYMDDKWRNVRLTARGQKRFEKEAEAAIIEYSKLRKAAIDEYNNLVKSGEIIPPHETKLEALLSVARGHPDNEGTQAARRLLKKRYGIISW